MPKLQDVLDRLTDVFTKKTDSNIGKLLSLINTQLQALEDTFTIIGDWREIDKAQGIALDQIGESVQQPRGTATDEVYRVMIRSKIARNLTTTDINTIISILTTALGALAEELTIKEMWHDETAPEPAAISITKVPLSRLNEIGMDPQTFGRIVQKTVAGGVRVAIIELSGTFEFASGTDYEEDINAGFSDIDGIDGGYFGAALVPADNESLPI